MMSRSRSQGTEVTIVTGAVYGCNRVWLQTALALSALARSDASASASDVTCRTLYVMILNYF